MRFEWDEAKRRSNLKRHGIDFAVVEKVLDGATFTILDDRFDYGEMRLQTLGLLRGEVVVITHTETDEVIASFQSERQRSMRKKVTSKKSVIDETDYKRLAAMTDKDIDFSDNAEIPAEMFARGIVRRGLKPVRRKDQLTLRVDSDVVAWYRNQGTGYQTKINALLRAYMEAHQGNGA